MSYKAFLLEKIAVPFGKFVEGGTQEFPQNELFLGRKKQRERLIRWLSSPSFGSLLVTGPRGVGKTSLVNNCIGQHNINLYDRLKQKGVNVSYGDRAILLLVFAFISLVLTFLYDLSFVDSNSYFVNVVLSIVGLAPSLVMIYWGYIIRRSVVHINEMTNYKRTDHVEAERVESFENTFQLHNHICSISTFLILFGCFCLFFFFFIRFCNQTLMNAIHFVAIPLFIIMVFNKIYVTQRCKLTKISFDYCWIKTPWDAFCLLLIGVVFFSLLFADIDRFIMNMKVTYSYGYLFYFVFIFSVLVACFVKEHLIIKKILKSHEPRQNFFQQNKKRGIYFSQWTISSILLRHYVPTIKVTINLGFEDLNHSNIIFAMLTGLRSKYRDIFMGNNYGFSKVNFLFLLVLSTFIWLFIKPDGVWDFAIIYFIDNVVVTGKTAAALYEISVSFMDVFGVFLIYQIVKFFLKKYSYSTLKNNLARIDDLLTELASKRVQVSQNTMGMKLGSNSLQHAKNVSNESEPLNSRLVETKMIDLLGRIKNNKKGWFLSPGKLFSVAVPSIIFVFDELDKLHDHSGEHNNFNPKDKAKNFTENEAARTKQIKKLLSDFKNFITVSPAKFIFIAGRDMRDQWLADYNSRDPFLSSIFDKELYVSSLLTDKDSNFSRMSTNVDLILGLYFRKVKKKYLKRNYRRQLRSSLFSESNEELLHEDYVLFNDTNKGIVNKLIEDNESFYKSNDTRSWQKSTQPCCQLVSDFICFLTYRSRGVPKQLKRTFIEYIEPVMIKDVCDDALVFDDKSISRIQFVSEVFQLIEIEFGDYLSSTDDKMASAMFYITDFILKFNDHAFSWRHLFRLDELAHIHRLPNLHRVFEKLVNHLTGFYLNKVLNGLYTFRFRSDISKEIAYLSKISDQDSAAYNFTLDESGDLKDIYKRKIDTSNELSSDLRVGLAELYDLDREFEEARSQYLSAIEIIDQKYKAHHSTNENNPIHDIVKLPAEKNETLKYNVKWGIERLGLMLQIGMTYERDNKPLYALANYQDAKSLSEVLFDSYYAKRSDSGNRTDLDDRIDVVKHISILYQPLFAMAWIVEKLPNGVDTSIGMIEKGIVKLRDDVQNMESLRDYMASSPSDLPHSNFLLIASQIHNKAGDLYFFKGKSADSSLKNNEGYLTRALYHYTVSIHEIRRFLSYRINSSAVKFNYHADTNDYTFNSEEFPDHVNLAIATNMMDIGETLISMVNCKKLIKNKLKFKAACKGAGFKEVHKEITAWLSKSTSDLRKAKETDIGFGVDSYSIDLKNLEFWFGKINQSDVNKLIYTEHMHSTNIQKLMMGLACCFFGIKHLKNSGYREFASKEAFELSQLVLQLIWLSLLQANNRILSNILFGVYYELIQFSINCTVENRFGSLSPQLLRGMGHLKIKNIRLRPEIKTSLLSSLYLYRFLGFSDSKPTKINRIFRRIFKRKRTNKALIKHVKKNEKVKLAKSNKGSFKTVTPNLIDIEGAKKIKRMKFIKNNKVAHKSINMKRIDRFRKARKGIKVPIITSSIGVLKYNSSEIKKLIDQYYSEDLHSSKSILGSLVNHLQENRYPMLNRLRGISSLIYMHKITPSLESKQAFEYFSELSYFNKLYDSPLLYTWTELAIAAHTTLSLVDSRSEDARWLQKIKNNSVKKARSMHMMGKTYYEEIRNLYYLHDDFNDRRNHLSQAFQMMCSELIGDM